MGRPTRDAVSGRDRLLDAAWSALVGAGGSTPRVSVASVCRDAGCTAPTLYHHFADLPDLLRAASSRAFANWSAHLESGVAATSDPAARLRMRAHAYLQWARDNPNAYRTMFTPVDQHGDGPGPGPGLAPLLSDVAALLGKEPTDPGVLPAALGHWAAVHGLASLEMSAPEAMRGVWPEAVEYLLGVLVPDVSAGNRPATGQRAPAAGRSAPA